MSLPNLKRPRTLDEPSVLESMFLSAEPAKESSSKAELNITAEDEPVTKVARRDNGPPPQKQQRQQPSPEEEEEERPLAPRLVDYLSPDGPRRFRARPEWYSNSDNRNSISPGHHPSAATPTIPSNNNPQALPQIVDRSLPEEQEQEEEALLADMPRRCPDNPATANNNGSSFSSPNKSSSLSSATTTTTKASPVYGKDGDPALHVAIKQDATNAALALLQEGCSVHLENARGATPLLLAAQRGNVAVVKRLLQLGADIGTASSNGSTAILQACHFGHRRVLNLLLSKSGGGKQGRRLVEVANDNGTTPLMRAAQEGELAICRDLVQLGASVNRKNHCSMSALMLASQRGHADVCQLLLDHGADTDAKTAQHSTSLLLACKRGHVNVVKVLVAAGSELWHTDTRGRTPRDVAKRRKRSKELLCLLDSAMQVHLMQQNARKTRSFELIKLYRLLQTNRATATVRVAERVEAVLGIHDAQPLLSKKKNPWLSCSTQALLRTMALPANLVEHIASYIPLPNLWSERITMLTNCATTHPDAAVASCLDMVDEILEEGGFVEACHTAEVTPPEQFGSWREWKNRARCNGPVCQSSEEADGFRPRVTTASVGPRAQEGPPSMIQMRRSAGFLSILANHSSTIGQILKERYGMSETLVQQLARCSDLASLVRRLGFRGGFHVEPSLGLDLVTLLGRLNVWYSKRPDEESVVEVKL